jgi:hypothetical protein
METTETTGIPADFKQYAPNTKAMVIETGEIGEVIESAFGYVRIRIKDEVKMMKQDKIEILGFEINFK